MEGPFCPSKSKGGPACITRNLLDDDLSIIHDEEDAHPAAAAGASGGVNSDPPVGFGVTLCKKMFVRLAGGPPKLRVACGDAITSPPHVRKNAQRQLAAKQKKSLKC